METIDRITPTWAKTLVVCLTLIGFVWLAEYSLDTHGYSAEERAALDELHAALEVNDYLTQLAEANGL